MPPVPSLPERSLRRQWITLAILAGCIAYVVVMAYVPGFTSRSPLICPAHRVLGLHCPSCGLTRAIACLVRLEPVAAVRFHPLVILVAPAVLLFTIDTCLAAAGIRGPLDSLPPAVVRGFWIAILAGFGIVFVVRLASWIAPEWNPSGWMLPPQAFPP